MNVDLFLNLTVQVITIVLDDAYRGEALVHSWVSDGRPDDWPPYVKLDGNDLYLNVTIYDRILSTSATRYRDGSACGTKNQPEYTCLQVEHDLVAV